MKEYKLALEIVFRLLEPWEEPETPFEAQRRALPGLDIKVREN